MVVIVASLVLMSAFVLLVEPGKTTPTRFSADFSDMQSYTLATNTSFEAKVASTDFSLLPVDLGQNLVSIGFYPHHHTIAVSLNAHHPRGASYLKV